MLTKLNFVSEPRFDPGYGSRGTVKLDSLANALGDRISDIQPISGGTLGLAVLARLDGEQVVLKTYTTPAGEVTLKKEYDILGHLYGDSIHLQKIEVADGDGNRLWLVMDEMRYPAIAFDADRALAISVDFTEKLKNFHNLLHTSPDIDFGWILKRGRESLRNLASSGFIADATQQSVIRYLGLIADISERSKPVLCHGDFGPKNVMLHQIGPVAIDWEDAFWGIEGYDYLYWLTFFENRKYYSDQMFGRTHWNRSIEIAIMLLILVIKSDISFRAAQYAGNKLTFEERLSEILAFG